MLNDYEPKILEGLRTLASDMDAVLYVVALDSEREVFIKRESESSGFRLELSRVPMGKWDLADEMGVTVTERIGINPFTGQETPFKNHRLDVATSEKAAKKCVQVLRELYGVAEDEELIVSDNPEDFEE